jgi:hypothetical protein
MARDSGRTRTPEAAVVRFLLRLPATLHASLVGRARARGVSLNEYITRRLAGADPHPSSEALTPLLVARAHAVAGAQAMGVILHGSWTRGEPGQRSDIDALVVIDDSLPLTRALYRRWDREPLAWEGRAVDVHFVHLPETIDRVSGVWCEAAIDGRVVADASGRVEDTLMRIRRAIADGRLVRKRVHGQPYWTVAA